MRGPCGTTWGAPRSVWWRDGARPWDIPGTGGGSASPPDANDTSPSADWIAFRAGNVRDASRAGDARPFAREVRPAWLTPQLRRQGAAGPHRGTRIPPMTMRRILLTVGGLLLLSAGSLAAQDAKVTCKDGTLSKGGQGACSSHGGIATKSTVKSESKAAATAAKADAKATMADAKASKAGTMAKDAKAEAKTAKADAKMAKAETKTAAKDMKADMKAEEKDAKGATALCKDNTYSH